MVTLSCGGSLISTAWSTSFLRHSRKHRQGHIWMRPASIPKPMRRVLWPGTYGRDWRRVKRDVENKCLKPTSFWAFSFMLILCALLNLCHCGYLAMVLVFLLWETVNICNSNSKGVADSNLSCGNGSSGCYEDDYETWAAISFQSNHGCVLYSVSSVLAWESKWSVVAAAFGSTKGCVQPA
jgi:hypothetical protein